MAARFSFRLFVGIIVFVIVGAWHMPQAEAVRRPGAPRPLRLDDGSWMQGIEPQVTADGLVYAGVPDPAAEGTREYYTAASADKTNPKATWQTAPLAIPPAEILQAFSPDGRRYAFVSRRQGQEGIYVQNLRDKNGVARRVATPAHGPKWLDNQTLIFDSGRPARPGLYKVTVPQRESDEAPIPQLIFEKGGEAAVSTDGRFICVAVRDEARKDSQLYLLASDGSGARSIPQTAGARRPCFTPSGDAIYFDAPAPRESNAPAGARVIWMLPLVNSAPAAQVLQVRAAADDNLEIIATAFSQAGGNLDVKLEVGEGEEPQTWKRIDTRAVPVHSAVLANWMPPAPKTESTWTLRLTVVDMDGDRAQSLLTFDWPLADASNTDVEAPPLFATDIEKYGLNTSAPTESPKPVATPKPMEIPPMAVPAPRPTPVAADPLTAISDLPKPAYTSAPRIAPSPPVAKDPTPRRQPKPVSASKTVIVEKPVNGMPRPSVEAPKPVVATAVVPVPKTRLVTQVRVAETPREKPVRLALKTPTPMPRPTATPKPKPTPKPTPKPAPTPAPKTPPTPNKSTGIPSSMKVGSTVPVTVVLRNTGSRSWSSQGDSPVRLIYRWVDAKTQSRHRWAIRWLQETVPPGGSTKLKFDLTAPPRAGEYILTYALVRLSPDVYDGKTYRPPSSTSGNHSWPGEFGAVSFRITVS